MGESLMSCTMPPHKSGAACKLRSLQKPHLGLRSFAEKLQKLREILFSANMPSNEVYDRTRHRSFGATSATAQQFHEVGPDQCMRRPASRPGPEVLIMRGAWGRPCRLRLIEADPIGSAMSLRDVHPAGTSGRFALQGIRELRARFTAVFFCVHSTIAKISDFFVHPQGYIEASPLLDHAGCW